MTFQFMKTKDLVYGTDLIGMGVGERVGGTFGILGEGNWALCW